MIIWGLYAFWGGVCIKKLVTEMSPVKTWIATRDSQRRFTLCSSSRGVEWQREKVIQYHFARLVEQVCE